LGDGTLIHSNVGDLLEKVIERLWKSALGALFKIEGLQIVLHVDGNIVNSCQVILLLDTRESVKLLKVIATSLLLEYLAIFFFSILKLGERSTLVHSSFTNTTPSGEYHI
jgi:hypothetical protein